MQQLHTSISSALAFLLMWMNTHIDIMNVPLSHIVSWHPICFFSAYWHHECTIGPCFSLACDMHLKKHPNCLDDIIDITVFVCCITDAFPVVVLWMCVFNVHIDHAIDWIKHRWTAKSCSWNLCSCSLVWHFMGMKLWYRKHRSSHHWSWLLCNPLPLSLASWFIYHQPYRSIISTGSNRR